MLPAHGSTAWRYLAVGLITVVIAVGLEFVTKATPIRPPTDSTITLYSAVAEDDICLPDGECGIFTMEIDSTRNGAGGVLCVNIVTDEQMERGCTDVTHTVRVDATDGIWADLPATTLDLYTLTCDESGTCMPSSSRSMAIEATWSTDSPANGSVEQEHTCAWPNANAGAVRPASLQLTIDGYSLRAFGSIRVATTGPIANCTRPA